jgi:hypothetical protein
VHKTGIFVEQGENSNTPETLGAGAGIEPAHLTALAKPIDLAVDFLCSTLAPITIIDMVPITLQGKESIF